MQEAMKVDCLVMLAAIFARFGEHVSNAWPVMQKLLRELSQGSTSTAKKAITCIRTRLPCHADLPSLAPCPVLGMFAWHDPACGSMRGGPKGTSSAHVLPAAMPQLRLHLTRRCDMLPAAEWLWSGRQEPACGGGRARERQHRVQTQKSCCVMCSGALCTPR
jgi:hypothetical protein